VPQKDRLGMKTRTEQVKSGGKVVANPEWAEYDSVAEAVGLLGEKATLGLINTQNGTNAKNKARTAATHKPGREALTAQAIQLMFTGEYADRLAAVKGDEAGIQGLLNEIIKTLQDAAPAVAE
jgi:hypothetical protein